MMRINPVSRLLCAAACLLAASSGAGAEVRGRVLRHGLFAGGDPIVRSGYWTFVEIELSYQGAEPFEGQLRINQLDRDGDVVTAVQPVALANTGEPRPYQVFFLPYDDQRRSEAKVRLFDEKGEVARILDTDSGQDVAELVAPTATVIPADDIVILDLTLPRRLPHLSLLDSNTTNSQSELNRRIVRSMSPRELPFQWQGLDGVDCVVWEDADPSGNSARQLEALIEWVRNGGRLLITTGRNWQPLMDSVLAGALPVRVLGHERVTTASSFLELVGRREYAEGILAPHYARNGIMLSRLQPTRDAMPVPAGSDGAIVYRRLLGSGLVTVIGASLNELLPPPGSGEREGESLLGAVLDRIRSEERDTFYETAAQKVVGRSLLHLPPEWRSEQTYIHLRPRDLYHDDLRGSISFSASSASFIIFAIVFAAAYTLSATLGSFWYLKRRAWEHHNWTAFALVGAIGVLIGTGMVWTLRGFRTRLLQTNVIDAVSGEGYGYGVCLFGIRTPNHTELDLRLPVDGAGSGAYGAVRPTPEHHTWDESRSRYVSPEVYGNHLAGMLLDDVPIRATLKEFQGRWRGPLTGSLDARLVVVPNPDRGTDGPLRRLGSTVFGEGSFIRNNLGITLRRCYLLETSDDSPHTGGAFVTGRAYEIGDLPASGEGMHLESDDLIERLYYTPPEADPTAPPEPREKLATLQDVLESWRKSATTRFSPAPGQRARGAEATLYEAARLLSVFNLLRPSGDESAQLRRMHGMSLDCTHRLSRQTALLIGYSTDPAPAVLETDMTRLPADKSFTIYRFVIPVIRE